MTARLASFGALPPSADWTPQATAAPQRRLLVAAFHPAALSIDLLRGLLPEAELARINLLGGVTDWYPRLQNGAPNCCAYAAAACLELMDAHERNDQPLRLSARFIHHRARENRAGRLEADGCVVEHETSSTKLCEVRSVVEREGAPLETVWPEPPPEPDLPPTSLARDDASSRRRAPGVYEDRPPPMRARAGLAQRVHAELSRGRPVAMALPGLRASSLRGKDPNTFPTNWNDDTAWRTGVLTDDGEDLELVEAGGHAVCVVGFQPAAQPDTRNGGGWFIFRNSWGVEFGREGAGSPPASGQGPILPAPGYGAFSAAYAEAWCWEWLSFASA